METEKRLSDYIGKELLLTQPKFLKRDYELKCGEEIIAKINHPKWYSSDFVAIWNKQKWEVYKPSIWRSVVEIKEAGKQLPFAAYQKTRFKSEGVVDLPRGQKLKLVLRVFKGSYEIQSISGERLVLIKDKASFKDKTEFVVEQRSELLDKYPWIILLAWYISSQRKHHSAAAAG
ncbi:MAG: hypothetical protein RDU14_05605 [Melioribacteraceae bacterium]|nr:hypothetical protein [Melioribacteraceae bacterium]